MGWRGTIRAIEAASRRVQREQERERKRLIILQRQTEKMNELERAQNEVALHESHIASLLSVHKQCSESVNWNGLLTQAEPRAPQPLFTHESVAETALREFSPSILDRIFGRVEQIRSQLERDIQLGKQRDQDEFKLAQSKHGDDIAEWEATRALAKGVLAGDPASFAEALERCNPFSDIQDLGSKVDIRFPSGKVADASFRANGPDVIPTETKSLLRNGRAATKKMPAGMYWELYQDYVCGCVLRIGREVFAILPIDEVVVTATAEILNPSTGHLEQTPIISARLVRRTLESLNFEKLDCSDSFRNFIHNMGFRRSSGFSGVERLPIT